MFSKSFIILQIFILLIAKSSTFPQEEDIDADDVTTSRSDVDVIDAVEIELEIDGFASDATDVKALKGSKPNKHRNGTETEIQPPYHVGKAKCSCGQGVTKIVGGENAKINDLPWTALLYKRGFFGGRSAYCGGTLINNLYVVTASHCVDGMGARGIEVALREENTATSKEVETQVFKVEKIIMHPGYSRRTVDNDIALLKLATPVVLSETALIRPVCVPTSSTDNTFVGENAVAAGWGATKEGGGLSKTLRKVTVPIISNEDCNMTKYKGKITENMLCAGDVEKGGIDSCQGDSGGPLVVETGSGRKMLVGVVSWGFGCAKKNAPGVYCRVSKYPEWILSHTTDAEWCNE